MIFGAGCGCLFLILLIFLGVYLYAGWVEYKEAPQIIEVQDRGFHTNDPYQLSSGQEEQLYRLGYPEAFTILFYEEETPTGGVLPVRLETWDYYSAGIGLTFINGELTAEDPIEHPAPAEIQDLPYYPEQFGTTMRLDEVIASAGIDTYVEIPLEKEFLKNGVVYYAPALSFGMEEGELRYIEALALVEE